MIKNKINNIYSKYEPYTRVIDEKILGDISLLRDTFETDIENAKQENRVLRIGIVGQIKRGKSSFLNSLLFDGKSVLPKAATPMTAALTKISYSEQPSATVEFYSKKEWAKVLEQANKVEQDEKNYQEQLNEFQASKAPGFKRQRGVRP